MLLKFLEWIIGDPIFAKTSLWIVCFIFGSGFYIILFIFGIQLGTWITKTSEVILQEVVKKITKGFE